VTPAEAEHFDTGQVLTMAGGHLVHDSFTAFLNPLLPLIIEKLNLSLTLAGTLSLYMRLPSLIQPLIGLLADRIDLRLLVILAPAVTAAAMSLIGLAPSYAILALLLVAAGLSSAALHVPGPVIVSRVSGERTGLGMSIWMMAGELARTVGPLLAVAVVSWWTLEGYYPVMVLGLLTSLILYLRFQNIQVRPPARLSGGSLREGWRAIGRLMFPLIFLMLFRGFMRAAIGTFLPVYMAGQSADLDLWAGGRALAVVEFAGALGALLAGTLSDRVGRRVVLFVALLTAPLFFLAFVSLDGGEWLKTLLLALTGFAALSTTPVIMAMVQDHGRSQPATANGIYMGANFLIAAAAAPVVGYVGDMADLSVAFTWSAIVSMVAAPLVFLLPRDTGKLSRETS
jgi:FSR family fosmidomycin resistance protein-like MFS transporter